MTDEDFQWFALEMYHRGAGLVIKDANINKLARMVRIRAPYKIVLTNGVFGGQGITPGQAWSIVYAYGLGRRPCSVVVFVALASDRVARDLKPYPVPPWEQRALAIVPMLRYNLGFVFEWDEPTVERAILEVEPDYWVKGGDRTIDDLDEGEKKAAEEVGAQIILVPELPLPHVSDTILS